MRVAETQLPERWLGGGQRDSHATVSHARCEGPSARAFTPKLTPGESESCGAERTRLSPRCSRPEKNGALFFTLYKRYVQRPIAHFARAATMLAFLMLARRTVARRACAQGSGAQLHRATMASHLFRSNVSYTRRQGAFTRRRYAPAPGEPLHCAPGQQRACEIYAIE